MKFILKLIILGTLFTASTQAMQKQTAGSATTNATSTNAETKQKVAAEKENFSQADYQILLKACNGNENLVPGLSKLCKYLCSYKPAHDKKPHNSIHLTGSMADDFSLLPKKTQKHLAERYNIDNFISDEGDCIVQ